MQHVNYSMQHANNSMQYVLHIARYYSMQHAKYLEQHARYATITYGRYLSSSLWEGGSVPSAISFKTWWRHQMETISALLAICAGNSPVTGEFPTQRPVTQSFDVFFYMCLKKRLSKQSWGWWFKTPSHPLWRQCNEDIEINVFPKDPL